jgi:flagellar hook-length control protein FliK
MSVSAIIANGMCVIMPGGEAADHKGRTAVLDEPRQGFADVLPQASAGIEPRTYKNTLVDDCSGHAEDSLPTDAKVSRLTDASDPLGKGVLVLGIGVAVLVPPGPARDVKEDGLSGGVQKEPKAGRAQSTSVAVTLEPAKARLRTGVSAPPTGRQQQSHTRVSSSDAAANPSQVSSSKVFTIVTPRAAATPPASRPVRGDVIIQKSGVQAARRGVPQQGGQKLPEEIKSGRAPSGRQSARSDREGGDSPVSKPAHDTARSDNRPGAFTKSETVVSGSTAGREPMPSGPQLASPGNPQDAANVHVAPFPAQAGEAAPLSQHSMAETQAGAGGGPAEDVAQSVGEQILDSMRASLDRGDNELVVRLHPPELGTVLVRFRENGEQISGLLEVSRSDTRHEIEQVLPPVLRSLQEAGIQMERLEVVLSGQPERDLARGQPQQDAWPQQHASSQDQGSLPPASAAHRHSAGTGYPTGSQEQTEAEWSPDAMRGRINMLL